MKFGVQEAAVVGCALVLAALAVGSLAISSLMIGLASLVLLNLLVVFVLLAVLRRASARAEAVARIERQVERLALRTASDAQANHREMLAALEKLADEVRPSTGQVHG